MRRPKAAARVAEAFPLRWSFLRRVPARPMTRCSPAAALILAFARGLHLAASVSGAGSHGSPSSPLHSIIALVPYASTIRRLAKPTSARPAPPESVGQTRKFPFVSNAPL